MVCPAKTAAAASLLGGRPYAPLPVSLGCCGTITTKPSLATLRRRNSWDLALEPCPDWKRRMGTALFNAGVAVVWGDHDRYGCICNKVQYEKICIAQHRP